MRAKDYRRIAKEKMRPVEITLVVSYLIYTVIASLLALTGVGGIALAILGGAFLAGLASIFLGCSRGEDVRIDNVFDGFKYNLGTNILIGLLIWLYTWLWSLLFVIPGIIKSYSYSMAYFILCDNPSLSPDEAITKSKEMMDGHKWELFCLDLSFIGWRILCVLTVGILSFWVEPHVQVSHAEFYEHIRPRPEETIHV